MKSCFVICPIGKRDSDVRKRSDQIMEYLITPVVGKCGYAEPVRADQLAKPGLITSQIIERLEEDDLVVADLSGGNPNVFYELAIRHAVKKPVVQLISEGEKIPFDVAMSRTIVVDHTDLDSVQDAKQELERQILAAEQDPEGVVNPISISLDLKALRMSGDPFQRSFSELTAEVQKIQAELGEVGQILRPLDRSRTFEVLEQKIDWLDRLISGFKPQQGGAYNLDEVASKVDDVESQVTSVEQSIDDVGKKLDSLLGFLRSSRKE